MSGEILIQISDAQRIADLDVTVATRWTRAADVTEKDRIDLIGPVCIIDDDDWVCDSLKVLLETYGFEVWSYSSGMDFLSDARRGKAKCLIVDQHMPTLDGLGVLAQLHRERVFPPTIMITGRLDAAIAERARQLGVLAVLEKPFPGPRLIELVRSAVGPQG